MSERDDILESLTTHRALLLRTVAGITDEQARQRLTVSELTLGGIVKHVSQVESGWADFVVDGPVQPGPEQQQAWMDGFVLREDQTLAGVIADYEKVAQRTDELVRTLPDLDASHPLPGRAVVPARRDPLGPARVRPHRRRDRAARGPRGHPARDARRPEDDGLAMGEKDQILGKLAVHRAGLRRKLDGLGEEDARKRTTVSELSLGGLLKHVAYGESGWIDFVVRGVKVDDLDRYAASFEMGPGETVAGLLERYDAVARRTEEVVGGLPSLDAEYRLPDAPWYPPSGRMTAREVLIHVLAETAQHTGHADILREALDGARG